MSITLAILTLVLVISIGYAALTTVLKINSAIGVGKVSFAIHFDNVGTLPNKATVNTEAVITDEAKKEISFDIFLEQLDDYYRFTTDIVNEGSIPGKIKSIELQGLTDSQKRLISYNLKYTSSKRELAVGDYFGPYSTKNVTVEVIYKLAPDVEDEDLPQENMNLNGILVINFENGDMTEYRSRAASSKLMQDVNFMNSSAVSFSSSATSSEHAGAYILNGTENDDFPIYFYRGGQTNTNNNVIFGGFCWRIIRTTETGGIKIIYNGTPTAEGTCPTVTGDAAVISTSYFGTRGIYQGSRAAQILYGWYFDNLINYQAYLEDTVFCNKTGFSNGNPTLACDEADQVSVANGRNSYPIGMITGQEANLCGNNTSDNSYPFLTINKSYWTMNHYDGDTGLVLFSGGRLSTITGSYGVSVTIHSNGIRPVVSLNSDTMLTDGDGSQTTPYHVSLS